MGLSGNAQGTKARAKTLRKTLEEVKARGGVVSEGQGGDFTRGWGCGGGGRSDSLGRRQEVSYRAFISFSETTQTHKVLDTIFSEREPFREWSALCWFAFCDWQLILHIVG